MFQRRQPDWGAHLKEITEEATNGEAVALGLIAVSTNMNGHTAVLKHYEPIVEVVGKRA